jgi:DNA invertase Pin-like site-specific DNA recombinase
LFSRREAAELRIVFRASPATPMGSMVFTVMAALAQMEHEIKRERVI